MMKTKFLFSALVLVLLLNASNGWALPPCPEDKYARWDMCYGTYVFDSGNKYVGEFKDDKFHGQGTYYILEDGEFKGDKYVGEYKDDKRDGHFAVTYGNGDKYVGEFKDDKKHGQGTYYYLADDQSKGAKFLGEYKDGKRNGQGTFTHANGDKYVGEFKDGLFHGQGTFTYANGDKYMGEWKNDKKHGQGTDYYLADNKYKGDKYVGEYKDDKRDGHFAVTYGNGDKYVGEFKDDKKHGQGIYSWADGTRENCSFSEGEEVSCTEIASVSKEEPKQVQPAPKVAPPSNSEELVAAASGTGFAVSSDGHIVTNNHVIDGCGDVKIHHDGNVIRASVVSRDKTNDLAVLKGDFEPEMVFPINEKNAKLMQEIYVAGYPFGSKISASLKITRGIISSLSGIGNNFSNIQIDAAIQPGNSGGPIFNKSGTVIGVAAHKLDLKYSLEKMGSIPENVNFGIKSSVLANFLDSNSISYKSGSRRTKDVSALGKLASNATYYLSCWMTMAQIEDMKTEKVLFSNFK